MTSAVAPGRAASAWPEEALACTQHRTCDGSNDAGSRRIRCTAVLATPPDECIDAAGVYLGAIRLRISFAAVRVPGYFARVPHQLPCVPVSLHG